MFGLKNIRGSCWVNTCLQLLFRIPDIQQRYDSEEFKAENDLDDCLSKIWKSKGEMGLREFFDLIYCDTLPAGKGIGDSHELLNYLCDKLPYLDNLLRFKIADSIHCKHCDYKETREDSVIEFSIATTQKNVPLIECIADVVKEYDVDEWTCEKCHKKGCRKQQLIGSFPKVMAFHLVPLDGNVEYTSILGLNKREYALTSVACYNGVHWWAYGRDMPPGLSWYTIDDTRIHDHGSKQFPLSSKARLLIYYRLEK
jgi:ubiquitin C-terminal hydrolase